MTNDEREIRRKLRVVKRPKRSDVPRKLIGIMVFPKQPISGGSSDTLNLVSKALSTGSRSPIPSF